MKIVSTIKEVRQVVAEAKKSGQTIGFVPTMGFLHEGHLSLIREAKSSNDFVVVSIFVNPTQFGPGEDFESYPRDLDRDAALCREAGADLIFHPGVEELYPQGYATYVEVTGELTKQLCGASRPGHFRGVTTVVNKFFNIVQPDCAYFGQKDAQQVAVINRMVIDTDLPVKIVACPIVREADGLALSSRNTYLTEAQRRDAVIISKSLFEARDTIQAGETSAKAIDRLIREKIGTVAYAEIDYIEIVDALSLEKLEILKGDVLIALAVKFGKPRLIDNIRLEAPSC